MRRVGRYIGVPPAPINDLLVPSVWPLAELQAFLAATRAVQQAKYSAIEAAEFDFTLTAIRFGVFTTINASDYDLPALRFATFTTADLVRDPAT